MALPYVRCARCAHVRHSVRRPSTSAFWSYALQCRFTMCLASRTCLSACYTSTHACIGARRMRLAALSGRLLTARGDHSDHCMQRVGERRGAADPLGRPALRRNGDRTGHRNQARTHRTCTARARSLRRTCRTCTPRARHGACCCAHRTHYSVRAIACACRHAVAHALGSVWMRSYVHARSWSDEWISLGLATYGAKLCLRELAGTRSAAVHCAAAARVR